MNVYNKLSVLLTIFLYVYLVVQIRKGDVVQNLATWLSWALLDAVTGISLYVQHGNWYLLLPYVIGSLTISYFILGSAKFTWGRIEIICFSLVIVSILVWTQLGPWYATIVATTGVSIATYPQIKDAFLLPDTMPIKVFIGFTLVNALAVAGGKDWTIEERFYPATCTVLCMIIVGFSSRKYFVSRSPDA